MKKDSNETDRHKDDTSYIPGQQDNSCLHEPGLAYAVKPQGTYTVEDYYRIPDERRVELIDGVIYDMSAPTSFHQLISGFIHARLLSFVTEKKGTCIPIISPVDVQLNCDNKTMIQPDVIIVCDRDKIVRRCVYGAPDFIIEVLSPSTRKKDMVIKLNKYFEAGVREYWMIDPDKKEIWVYDFSAEETPASYSFDDKVPIAIWDNECSIDFKEIYEHIRFLYEREK